MNVDTSLELIQDLDFSPDVACEWPEDATFGCASDSHSADWYVATHCSGPMAICDLALKLDNRACTSGLFVLCACTVCGAMYPMLPYRVLGPVRP